MTARLHRCTLLTWSLAATGVALGGCGEPKEVPSIYEDPQSPGPMVRLQVPDPDVDVMGLVCESYRELQDDGIPAEEIMLRTAERAIEKGGTIVRIQTERWGGLLPPELYFDVRNRAVNRPECNAFLAFLKQNVEATAGDVEAYRAERARERAEREAAYAAANTTPNYQESESTDAVSNLSSTPAATDSAASCPSNEDHSPNCEGDEHAPVDSPGPSAVPE